MEEIKNILIKVQSSMIELIENQGKMQKDIQEMKQEQQVMKQDIQGIKQEQQIMQQNINKIQQEQQKMLEVEEKVLNEIVLIERRQSVTEKESQNYGKLISKINSKLFNKTAQ